MDKDVIKKLKERLSSSGYLFKSPKYYKITDDKYSGEIGVKVGEFYHSCHVESSDIYVILLNDLGGNHLVEVWDMHAREVKE